MADDLREKVARMINDRPFTGGREVSATYASDRKHLLKQADAILAIPEIREALEHYDMMRDALDRHG